MRVYFMIGAIAALAGCSSNEERLCKADIAGKLINPETVEFFDFVPLSPDMNIDTLWRRQIVGTEGIRLHYQSSSVRNQLQPEIDRLKSEDKKVNATYATYRIKAESRIGLKVTSEYFCRIGAGECSCGPMVDP